RPSQTSALASATPVLHAASGRKCGGRSRPRATRKRYASWPNNAITAAKWIARTRASHGSAACMLRPHLEREVAGGGVGVDRQRTPDDAIFAWRQRRQRDAHDRGVLRVELLVLRIDLL